MTAARMRTTKMIASLATFATIMVGAAAMLGAGRKPVVEHIDFATAVTATMPAFDAALQPISDANIREYRIPITDVSLTIADGVTYEGWTFGGTVPGPVIHARVGDKVRVNVVNETPMPHSIDFHAARIPANVAYRTIVPNDSISFEFTPRDAGAFLVHCGTPPVTMHMMQGMYFTMIVEPEGGWGTTADKEFVLVQSEFYTQPAGDEQKVEEQDGEEHADAQHMDHTRGTASAAVATAKPDWSAAMAKQASYVTFNGRAFQYKANPLKVEVGDRVRFFVVNAGPSFRSDFHVVGAVFDRVYPDGNPKHVLEDIQTYTIPAGGGAVFETVFDKDGSGEGIYAFVTHSFADAEKGAVGLLQVGTPKQFATMSH